MQSMSRVQLNDAAGLGNVKAEYTLSMDATSLDTATENMSSGLS